MADLVVYGVPLSPFVRKVEVVLREKGLEYDFETANIMPMPDWFKEISPARRIPVLRDRRVGTEGRSGTIPDSAAISAYAEHLSETPRLYPDGAFPLGRAIWLEKYADTELAGSVGMGIFRPIMFNIFQGKQPDIDKAKETWTEVLPIHFDYLEGELDEGDHFIGNELSIADIAVGSQLAQLDLIVGPPDSARWPSLVNLLNSLKERSSFRANLSVCEKMLSKVLPQKVALA